MIKVLKEVTKKDLENWIYHIDEEDLNLYKEANNPNKIGIFQISGSTAERLCEEVKPENFDELMAINAMARPGPLETAAPFFVSRKEGQESSYPEAVNEILSDTRQVFIYQEQIMECFHKIGGFTLEEANDVRNLMKKLGKAEKKEEDLKRWNRAVKKFVKGAVNLGIEEHEAEKIANDLASFSGYSFNKSHAASYTYIALITLYLSYYFRPYFYSAVLKEEFNDDKYFFKWLSSIKRQGIEILPPDINTSDLNFRPDNDKIRFGLNNIKFVGEKAAQIILENRPYSSIFDFYLKTKSRSVTIRVFEALISVGAFDNIYSERKKLLQAITMFWEKKKSNRVEEKLRAIFDDCFKAVEAIPALDTSEEDKIGYEKKFFGFNVFFSLFTKEKLQAFDKACKMKLMYSNLNSVKQQSKKVALVIESVRNFNDKNGNEMAFLTVSDMYGVSTSLPVFASYWKHIGRTIKKDNLYLMNVYKSNRDSILFGQNAWTENEAKIRRMIKHI